MILDLRKIERSGKDSQDFFFEYVPKNNLVSLPDTNLVTPVKVEGTISLTGKHTAYICGEVCCKLEGSCTRCLTQTERQFVFEFEEEIDNDNEDSYPIVNDTIDLSKIVEDVIVMNLPLNFLCKDDCKGLCEICGKNLNDGACQCKNK